MRMSSVVLVALRIFRRTGAVIKWPVGSVDVVFAGYVTRRYQGMIYRGLKWVWLIVISSDMVISHCVRWSVLIMILHKNKRRKGFWLRWISWIKSYCSVLYSQSVLVVGKYVIVCYCMLYIASLLYLDYRNMKRYLNWIGCSVNVVRSSSVICVGLRVTVGTISQSMGVRNTPQYNKTSKIWNSLCFICFMQFLIYFNAILWITNAHFIVK